MTTFIENSSDYLGETVTVTGRHRLDGEREMQVCPCDDACTALVWRDGPLRGWDVDSREYEGTHRAEGS